MTAATQRALDWAEQGRIPDAVIRTGIRRLLAQRLDEIGAADCAGAAERTEALVAEMDRSPIALVPELANAQHYEVPSDFYAQVLGPRRKYSACFWEAGTPDLASAEDGALALTCDHADLADDQDILELGCGWGSLSLWMAERYPKARILALSNSHSQRAFIEGEAARRGLTNLRVITVDVNHFSTEQRFDRIVSVEMFEHMRNWRALLGRVHHWLRPQGRFLMHVFCHRSTPYFYEDRGPSDWMGRHFFSGGLMPSDALPLRFQDGLRLRRQWRWDGRHYAQTLDAWLGNLDARGSALLPLLAEAYGGEAAERWLQRWRIFFMACAELFGYDQGQQWWVSHYLFDRREGQG